MENCWDFRNYRIPLRDLSTHTTNVKQNKQYLVGLLGDACTDLGQLAK